RPHGVLAARPQRRDPPRRPPAARLPLHGGRQQRNRHPVAMKVLVTGAGGMLGQDVVSAARKAGDEVAALARAELDVTEASAVGRAVAEAKPDAVINC